MLVVSLGGSPSAKSRSNGLLEYARRRLELRGVEVISYQVRDFHAEDLLHANFASLQVRQFIEQVSRADGLLVATPVYKASFSGALKTLLDLLPERALQHKVALPIASGGTPAHMLAVDYALKPVLAALKAQEVLQGVFADDSQIQYLEECVRLVPDLEQRLNESLDQLLAALARRPKPIDPQLLNDRLVNARWSI
ncbi:NADPH-dependent FMN reductase [Pseudomonas sp. PDM15]|jgi:FMN reductase|uniref:NADPH-dependent FMN reductase n=1 Tax=Pseudomonas sp. PDM15 TaxID=2769303 RepID=UPI00178426E5|nr:NADPH-dependent FMN reductase [Pseudomonas sp. PDM15]MBD9426212.1 NADPH-dependent FMN reductase [Pseudomonas sp. PDM15]